MTEEDRRVLRECDRGRGRQAGEERKGVAEAALREMLIKSINQAINFV